jgi:hypothetical protein
MAEEKREQATKPTISKTTLRRNGINKLNISQCFFPTEQKNLSLHALFCFLSFHWGGSIFLQLSLFLILNS